MIKTIGVCGAGTMGSGIAQVAAMGGYTTLLYDVDAAMVQKGRSSIEKGLQILVDKNKLSPDEHNAVLSRLQYSSDIADCVADLIIEAVVERPEVKSGLFRRLAEINAPDAILSSNTS